MHLHDVSTRYLANKGNSSQYLPFRRHKGHKAAANRISLYHCTLRCSTRFILVEAHHEDTK